MRPPTGKRAGGGDGRHGPLNDSRRPPDRRWAHSVADAESRLQSRTDGSGDSAAECRALRDFDERALAAAALAVRERSSHPAGIPKHDDGRRRGHVRVE